MKKTMAILALFFLASTLLTSCANQTSLDDTPESSNSNADIATTSKKSTETDKIVETALARDEQAGIALDQYALMLKEKGWENQGTAWDAIYGDKVILPIDPDFPAPVLADDEVLYTTVGRASGEKGSLLVAIMLAFKDDTSESRLAGMFYAVEGVGGTIVSAEHFNYELLDANDETLWSYMYSE